MQGVGLGTIVGVIIQAILGFVPGLGEIVGKLGINIAGLGAVGVANAGSGAVAGAVSGATSSGSAMTKAIGGLIAGGLSSGLGAALIPMIQGGGFDLMSVLTSLVAGGVGGGVLGGLIPGKKG
ncbi:MAG: hypothetical protein JNL56_02485 [Alphaproteobacteria bacterium]|nr:hypothetical protein [Alphaproteobacteria bacterium]